MSSTAAPTIAQLDPNFAQATVEEGLRWYDIRALGLEGQGWSDVAAPYDRLPAKAEKLVRDAVWSLSRQSAGLCVRFVTDATKIAARWRLRVPHLAMDHMPATGVSGLDLYCLDGPRWRFAGVGRPTAQQNQSFLLQNIPAAQRQFLLYLPLYNGVEEVRIGVPEEARIEKAPLYPAADQRPICFYGTSINQGGCASRPGMCHTAILHRRLNRPVINLGFSGNAKSEPEVAQLLAELDPCVYVLDPLPNMAHGEVRERLGPLVQTLRRARPHTPIVLVGNIVYQTGWIDSGKRVRSETSEAALLEVLHQLQAQGMGGLHYVPGASLLGDDDDATVDGTHPTDVGFLRMANAIEPALRKVLA